MGSGKTSIVIGATGLVGACCVRRLLAEESTDEVVVLARRKPPLEDSKLTSHIVDFTRPEGYASLLKGDEIYCCFGSTIKDAGSRENFLKIDKEMPLACLQAAAANGVQRLLLVSSSGADPGSRIFYSRTKGEIEEAAKALGFQYTGVFRPSLLLGKRERTRPAEVLMEPVMRALSFMLLGPLRKYRAIRGDDVAKAMIRVARQDRSGNEVFESDAVQALADRS